MLLRHELPRTDSGAGGGGDGGGCGGGYHICTDGDPIPIESIRPNDKNSQPRNAARTIIPCEPSRDGGVSCFRHRVAAGAEPRTNHRQRAILEVAVSLSAVKMRGQKYAPRLPQIENCACKSA